MLCCTHEEHACNSPCGMLCAAVRVERCDRPDEKARIERSGGSVDTGSNRVVSAPKDHTNHVTLLNMSRCSRLSPLYAALMCLPSTTEACCALLLCLGVLRRCPG